VNARGRPGRTSQISVRDTASEFLPPCRQSECYRERRVQIPLALILGGAIGNLLDRFYQGPVTDFLHAHWQDKIASIGSYRFVLSWPAFNIADSAITCGAIALMLVILFGKKKDA